jgi:hypothetical protein
MHLLESDFGRSWLTQRDEPPTGRQNAVMRSSGCGTAVPLTASHPMLLAANSVILRVGTKDAQRQVIVLKKEFGCGIHNHQRH